MTRKREEQQCRAWRYNHRLDANAPQMVCEWNTERGDCAAEGCGYNYNGRKTPFEFESPSGVEGFGHAQYECLIKDTIARIEQLSKQKGGEYAGDHDRLANFRRNGAALDLPMETIWRVYAGKHWDAISQYIRDLQSGKTRTRMEPVSGRADDLIVYLILFKAMLIERGEQ